MTLVFGEPNCTRLSALNASRRAWSRTRPARLTTLNIEKSRLRVLSVRSTAEVAPALPNVNAAG